MKVTFAYPYTDAAGKKHAAESTADLPDTEARTVLREGNARPADAPSRKAVADATAEPTDSAQTTTSRSTRHSNEKKG